MTKDDNVIFIVPQLLCRALAQSLGRIIEGDPDASPAAALELCNELLLEVGAVKDENGVWQMPEDEDDT